MNDTTAELIKAAREKAGLTQSEIANTLNVSRQSYSQYERGTRSPKFETLHRIADAIGCDVFDLIPLEEPAPSDLIEETYSDHIYSLLRRIDSSFDHIVEKEGLEYIHNAISEAVNVIEFQNDILRKFDEKDLSPYPRPNSLHDKINMLFMELNTAGREKLAEYASDLASMPKYTE